MNERKTQDEMLKQADESEDEEGTDGKHKK